MSLDAARRDIRVAGLGIMAQWLSMNRNILWHGAEWVGTRRARSVNATTPGQREQRVTQDTGHERAILKDEA